MTWLFNKKSTFFADKTFVAKGSKSPVVRRHPTTRSGGLQEVDQDSCRVEELRRRKDPRPQHHHRDAIVKTPTPVERKVGLITIERIMSRIKYSRTFL